MRNINRNVSIVVILLILVLIAGYLIWLRSRYQPVVTPKIEEQVQATVAPTMIASPSATPGAKEATGSMKAKSATSGAMKK